MLTVNPSELHGMLTDLQRSAGNDPTMPMLDGILLHVDVNKKTVVLVGTSTNRFIAGQAHVEASGELDSVFLRNVQTKQVLAALKPYVRTESLLCELSTSDGGLTLKLPGDIVLPEITITVKVEDQKFPKMKDLFDRKMEAQSEGGSSFDGRFIAAFGAIARRRKEYLRLALSDEKSAARVYIGAQYKAIAMTCRNPDLLAAPTFVLPDEKPALEAKPAAA